MVLAQGEKRDQGIILLSNLSLSSYLCKKNQFSFLFDNRLVTSSPFIVVPLCTTQFPSPCCLCFHLVTMVCCQILNCLGCNHDPFASFHSIITQIFVTCSVCLPARLLRAFIYLFHFQIQNIRGSQEDLLPSDVDNHVKKFKSNMLVVVWKSIFFIENRFYGQKITR